MFKRGKQNMFLTNTCCLFFVAHRNTIQWQNRSCLFKRKRWRVLTQFFCAFKLSKNYLDVFLDTKVSHPATTLLSLAAMQLRKNLVNDVWTHCKKGGCYLPPQVRRTFALLQLFFVKSNAQFPRYLSTIYFHFVEIANNRKHKMRHLCRGFRLLASSNHDFCLIMCFVFCDWLLMWSHLPL